jgi:CBS domain-containing protein
MKVADFMSRSVISVAQDVPILEAAKLMVEHKISGLPVINSEGGVVGIVSEHDLLRRSKNSGRMQVQHWLQLILNHDGRTSDDRTFAGRKVADVMTLDPVTVAATSSLDEACRVIEKLGVKRLPVVEDGKLVGIVARADLVRALIHTLNGVRTASDVSINQHVEQLERQVLRERARASKPF